MEKYSEAVKFHLWKKELEKRNVEIRQVKELASVHNPKGHLLFTMIHTDAVSADGEKLLPVVLIRGHFVSIVTVLINQDSGEKFLLLVKQRRIANGDYFWEHPAGMCDSETDPYKVCEKELSEETGISIPKNQFIPLNDGKMYYSSPGLLDEAAYYFYTELVMKTEEIEELKTRIAGAKEESEFIETQVCPLREAMEICANAHTLLQIYLYLQHKNLITIHGL